MASSAKSITGIERTSKNKTARFGCPMILITENITSQCVRILHICIARKKCQYFLHNFRLECGNFTPPNTNSCKIWKTLFATFCSPITFASKPCNFSKFIDVVPSSGVRYCSPYPIKH